MISETVRAWARFSDEALLSIAEMLEDAMVRQTSVDKQELFRALRDDVLGLEDQGARMALVLGFRARALLDGGAP